VTDIDIEMFEAMPSRETRRQFLRSMGVLGAAAAFSPAFLAACGSSKKTATGGGAGAAPADAGKELATLLKIDEKTAGKGKEFPMGAVLALTGPGSFYGKTMQRGIDLAVEHIAAAGGPAFKVTYFDHKSGDAPAGKQAITEIVAKKIPAKLASYVDDLGAMLEDTAKNKVFTLDGGGGTSIFGQKIPYFWGTRGITPNDPMPGLFKWWLEANPGKKKVGLVGWDVGDPNNGIIKDDVLAKIKAGGMEHNGLYELVPVGGQDFSAVLPKIKANEPDLLIVSVYGQDPGSFANQAATAGLKAKVIGFEFTPDGVSASKGVYDKDGWTFAYDYFDSNNPTSPLAKLFVSTFKAKYGELPDFYAANFYENTLVMWEVIRRVNAKGGDILSGEALDKALQENLTVVSVYGGDAKTVGTYTLDPVTHSVSKRDMGIFEYKGGKVTPKAFFGINAEGYKKV
jgi:branched-chain amino acid transport system substrate-binding protein